MWELHLYVNANETQQRLECSLALAKDKKHKVTDPL